MRMSVRASGVGAFNRLVVELGRHTPACTGDTRFTADDITTEDIRLAVICSSCPVLDACHTYAATSSPAAGFWAGQRHHIARKGTS